MKKHILFVMVLSAVVMLAGAGCSRPANTNAELDKAAKTIAAEEASQKGAAVPAAAPARSADTATAVVAQTPAQQMDQAIAAYKKGELQDAVTQLQKLRAQAAISPGQRMALQDAMAAVMTDIYARAAKGDASAQQAVKEYERMQNRR